jgi:hypothetical protein
MRLNKEKEFRCWRLLYHIVSILELPRLSVKVGIKMALTHSFVQHSRGRPLVHDRFTVLDRENDVPYVLNENMTF